MVCRDKKGESWVDPRCQDLELFPVMFLCVPLFLRSDPFRLNGNKI